MKGFRERRRAPARLVVVRSVVLAVARRKVRVVRKPRPVAPATPAREGN